MKPTAHEYSFAVQDARQEIASLKARKRYLLMGVFLICLPLFLLNLYHAIYSPPMIMSGRRVGSIHVSKEENEMVGYVMMLVAGCVAILLIQIYRVTSRSIRREEAFVAKHECAETESVSL